MKINKKDWYKDFNRPLDLNQAQFYSWSCANGLEELINIAVKHQLYYLYKDSADGYFLKKEIEEFNNYVMNNNFNNPSFLKDSNSKTIKQSKNIENFFSLFKKINFDKLSKKEILQLFSRSTKILNKDIAALWVGFLLNQPVNQKIDKIIGKYNFIGGDFLEIVGSLDKPNYIIQEQLDLMQIVIKNINIKRSIIRHYEKYAYIPCYSVGVKPYSISHFEKRIKKIKVTEAKEIINEIKESFKQNKIKYKKFLQTAKLDKIDLLFVQYCREFIFLKDHRSHYRSLASFNFGELLSNIAGRYDLKVSQVLLLLQQEIKELLTYDFLPDHISNIINKREKENFYYLYFDKHEEIIYKSNLFIDSKFLNKKIVGVIANKGLVRGKVKKVMNPNDINKVKLGDILVSSMTRPDYILAMKRCGAIITDEGGITCHAAIVSREMKKPCIIGTKIATQVLKDGDLVEVDANKGVVKILKNN